MKAVYQLADLDDRATLDAGCALPARLAVIGWPVAHSASPVMHQAALDAAGIDARYIRLEVQPGRVGEALDRMRALDFIGCNVTVPHKLEVMDHCHEIDGGALALGAVNTVHFESDAVRGWNTDGPGFAAAVMEVFGLRLAGLRVAIIGAGGGAGRALAAQCALDGAVSVALVNRTVEKLAGLARQLRELAPATAIRELPLADPELAACCRECDLIVNAASAGLRPGDSPLLDASCFAPACAFYDCIYEPVTPLMALAQAQGCRVANGRTMLLHQG
ncbi:MAG: shikimate dehydrogenase, partial [Akkermansiaceae bacterium]|nr:shikimate dehydrogenase [Akkermansiaceae bacterium]